MRIIAITGSIGCGKTTLAGMVKSLGYGVYDVDARVRGLYQQRDFLAIIRKEFPFSFENGIFNKRILRDAVFKDTEKLARLEKLIHPFLKENLRRYIRKYSKNTDLWFVDIALLYELGWEKLCHFVILAEVDYETQKKRVMARDHISKADFDRIVSVQMDNGRKKLLADAVINTNKPKNLLLAELIGIIENIKHG